MKAGLRQHCIDLEAYIFHQVVDIVAMVLEKFNLIGLVQLDAFSELARLRLLNQSLFISLNLWTDRVIFDGFI